MDLKDVSKLKELIGKTAYAINTNNGKPVSLHRVKILSIYIDDNSVKYGIIDIYADADDEWGERAEHVYSNIDEAYKEFKKLISEL